MCYPTCLIFQISKVVNCLRRVTSSKICFRS
ncbi:hypothetical protein NXF25_013979 [Crotalus adamanteus]|uniref:Uncharacterized protein n=1 Tax=Crotalus adamanteus TaxID=8729 RepID=A0AAW1BAC6_CROAD